MWRVQVTRIYIDSDSPLHLLMSWALRALQKPGQLQHALNRANMIRSSFFFFSPHPFPYPHSGWIDFFFLQSPVKLPKRVSLEHGFMEEANRLSPLGHELIKSKTRGQIRPRGQEGGDERGPTVCSDKRVIKIKVGRLAQKYTGSMAERGQRMKVVGLGRQPFSHKVSLCEFVLYPGEACHLLTVHKCAVIFVDKRRLCFWKCGKMWIIYREHKIFIKLSSGDR